MSELKICPFINGKCLTELCEMYNIDSCAISSFFKSDGLSDNDDDIDKEVEIAAKEMQEIYDRRIELQKNKNAETEKQKAIIAEHMNKTTEQIANNIIEFIKQKNDGTTGKGPRQLYANSYENDYWDSKGVDINFYDTKFYNKRRDARNLANTILRDHAKTREEILYCERVEAERLLLQHYVEMFKKECSITKLIKNDVELFLSKRNIDLLPDSKKFLYMTLKDYYRK